MASGSKGKTGTVAVLDVGTSKIACMIAQIDAGERIRVTGIGHQLSRGIRSGIVTDVNEAQTSIVAAVHAAEQMAGQTIENVSVSLSGLHLQSREVSVELALAGEAVSERDIADIIQEGRASLRSNESEIIHCIPVSYTLDTARGINDPRSMVGSKLGAELHMITAPSTMLRNLAICLARCHLDVSEYIVASYASALAVLEKDEADLGVVLVEMGAGVTSFAVCVGGKVVYTDSVPLGGMHVTNDIAKGLSTTLAHAERVKTLHGSAIIASTDDQAMIEVPQLGEENGEAESSLISRSMLIGIIRPRMEEIFEMIRHKLEASGYDKAAGRRVVLTGGASQLMGLRDLATRVLGKQVRLGKPHGLPGLAEVVSGPSFSTPIGMLEYLSRRPLEDVLFEPARIRLGVGGTMNKIVSWFRENF